MLNNSDLKWESLPLETLQLLPLHKNLLKLLGPDAKIARNYEKLSCYVGVLKALYRVLSTIDTNEPHSDVCRTLDSFLESTLTNLPESLGYQHGRMFLSEVQQLCRLKVEFEQLEHAMDHQAQADMLTTKKHSEIEQDYLNQAAYVTSEAERQPFVYRLCCAVEVLKAKNKRVCDILNSEQPPSEIEDARSKLPLDGRRELMFSPFSVAAVFEPTSFTRHFRSSASGLYFRDSMLIAIRQNEAKEREEATRRHEEFHNLVDCFQFAPTLIESRGLAQDIKDPLSILKYHLVPNKTTTKLRLKPSGIARLLLDCLHEEMIATIEGKHVDPEGKLRELPDTEDEMLLLALFSGSPAALQKQEVARSYHWHTAGMRYRQIQEALQETIDSTDEKSARKARQILSAFGTKFNSAITAAKSSFKLAQKLEGEALMEARFLLHLLPPSQWKHAAIYIHRRFISNNSSLSGPAKQQPEGSG